jgi:membrane fusion protein (multidrug efflux system)
MKRSERQAVIESIRNAIRQIEGDLAGSGNAVEQIENDLRRQSVLAPDKGRLGSVMNLKPGAYVREGDTIAAIIAEGHLRIVAEYEPNAAIGRIRPGQIGRLHLDGFPWTEYGSVTGSVTSVGNEVRDGRVRVELDPAPNSRIPLQHGLPGTLEIAMERVSPAAFLLRTAGGYLVSPAIPPTTPPDSATSAK